MRDTVLEMRAQGMGSSEIARQLGIPRGTVDTWIRRGPAKKRTVSNTEFNKLVIMAFPPRM